MRVLVITGSGTAEPSESCFFDPSLPIDLVVLADGGGNCGWPWEEGCSAPVLLVGDMDSILPAARAAWEVRGAEVTVLPRAKDETDLEFALRAAVERGAEEFVVFGALGGPRLDHLLGAINLLTAPWLRGRLVRLLDNNHEVMLASGAVEISGRPGDLVSLIPLTEGVENVTATGVAYPLCGERLLRWSTRGVSNELAEERARVTHGEGDLLVVHSRPAGAPGTHPASVSSTEENQHGASSSTGTVACQFSLYPLRQTSLDEAIRAGIEAAARAGAAAGLSVRVQTLSTLMQGPEDVVFAAARAAFTAAGKFGPAVMVSTFTGGAPTEEVVADIQRRHVDEAQGRGGEAL